MHHYHIRWSGKAVLDWECFETPVDAHVGAAQLVHWGETYTIEEHGESCARCRDAMNLTIPHVTVEVDREPE